VAYKKVLVIEDEEVLRKIIVRNLSAHGVEALEAASVEEGLGQLENGPELVLLDINLPGQSGWELLRTLRNRGQELPTVIVSAVRVSPDRLEEFKPLAYLPKPFPIEALLRIVNGNQEEEDGA